MIVGRRLRLLAYPQLREFPAAEWGSVLQRARDTAFDAIEWMGILAGLAFVTYLLRPGTGEPGSLFALSLMQFVLALPLLAVFVGPFLWRRTRRGLDLQLAQLNGGNQCTHETHPHIGDVPRHSTPGRPE